MNKIQLGIDAISTTPIRIGFEGENVHTQVTFFWTVLRSKYPDAVASLSIKPPVGDIYPKSVTQDGNKVVWDVTASDTANPGSGEYQLTFTDGEEIIKTYIGNFTVNDSIIGDGEAPDPIQDWVADANAVLGELSEISASVTTLEAGESATVEVTEVGGHKNLAFGIPAGEKGEQGEPGDPAPAEEVIPAVNAYLAEVITNPDSPPLDRTLSSSSAAAPADMVGDLKSALTHSDELNNSIFSSKVIVGTKQTDGTGFYVKLPVTTVNGKYYVCEFTIPSDMVLTVTLNTYESGSSEVEVLAKDRAYKAGKVYFVFQKTSSKGYMRLSNSGAVLPVLTQTYYEVQFETIDKMLYGNIQPNFVDYGEAMSDMVLVGSSVLTNSNSAMLPGNAAYEKTFYAEFELANDVDKVLLTINGSSAYNTVKKTIFNNVPLKAGKYGFIFYRTREMNYIRTEFNGSVPTSLTVNFYNVEKNFNALNIRVYGELITYSNYATKLPDLNSALDNTLYVGQVRQNDHPANMPFDITKYTTFELLSIKQGTYTYQVFFSAGKTWTRYSNGTVWLDWASPISASTFIVGKNYTDGSIDANGNVRYSSLVKAIEKAIENQNSTVYVEEGEYDILAEYQAEHPEDWSTRNNGRGLRINNGIHLVFSSKAQVVCNYTGSDESVLTNFSPFNVIYGSATIENLHISASRVRYCVHDDPWDSATPYHVTYKDCMMKIDNSENPYRSDFPHCIGGGFGQNAHIVIQNCIFEGIGGDGTTYPVIQDNAIVNWHNGPSVHQRSDLFMNGCYFKGNGTFGISSHGTSEDITTALISGNSFGSNIIVREPESGNPVNIEVFAFNNEVRV